MKLAEALSIRADLQRKVCQLRARLKDSSKVQVGDTLAEQVTDLFLQNLGLQPLSTDMENRTEESSEIDNVSR